MTEQKYFIYDIETFPNIFLLTGKYRGSSEILVYEISTRKNMRVELVQFLTHLKNENSIMVGFNNVGFDYPIIHDMINSPYTFDALKAYQLCQQIINSQEAKTNYEIKVSDRFVAQLDLQRINHFDNMAKRTRLKDLQFAMRSETVEDLPFEVGKMLNDSEMDTLVKYNIHDVTETEKFFEHCQSAIKMRHEIASIGLIKGDVLNFNDVKIGEQYLVSKIGRSKCYNGYQPRQTIRSEIQFKHLILPKINFNSWECFDVLEWFKNIVIYPTKKDEKRPKLETRIADIDFVFGLGGVHASVESQSFKSCDKFVIKDIDVSGMYPAVANANKFYPEHLGEQFLEPYKQLQVDRKQYKKGSSMNKLLKLAGNGVYGKSNDIYSCFYDPKYTYSVTVNGQLQALQLVEKLITIPGLKIIQANTDGITALVPRNLLWSFDFYNREWEVETGLTLEEVEYSDMYIRDVNNYIAIKNDGSVKLKGAYWYPKSIHDYEDNWHKDHSMIVVQKCAEIMIVNGLDPEIFVKLQCDKFDFMKRYKVKGQSKVFVGDQEVSRTVRYYVSTKGQSMFKHDPPKGEPGSYKRKNKLTDKFYKDIVNSIPKGQWDERIHTGNKSKYNEVITGIESGWLVKVCNNANDFDWEDVDWNYYIEEVKKLKIKES